MCLNTALLIIFAQVQCHDQFFMCIILYAALVEFQVESYLHLSSFSDKENGRPEAPYSQERSECFPRSAQDTLLRGAP